MIKAADLQAQALELGITASSYKSMSQANKIALMAAMAQAQIATSLAALEGQVLAASTAPAA